MTRHLRDELAAADWDMMTLHYLGLDHIGHLYGPASNLVAPKLQEMDAVVRQIYTAMKSWVMSSLCVHTCVFGGCLDLEVCVFVCGVLLFLPVYGIFFYASLQKCYYKLP